MLKTPQFILIAVKRPVKWLILPSLLSAFGAWPAPLQAGPMGPSAKMAARLKKYPTSKWLAHYLPDDRYKIAGGIWKYVSTDLDTYYHRPDSPLMLRQPAGRVIGFSSAREAEEAGYRPDPNLGAFGAMDMGMASSTGEMAMQRVVLADGVSSLSLPKGWRKTAAKLQRSQYVTSTTEAFFGPKGDRFEVATVVINSAPGASAQVANMDMGQIVNVRFFNQLKANMKNMAGNIDRLSSSSGAVNSQFSGQNMISSLNQLDNLKVFRISMSGIEGVGTSSSRLVAGQPRRSYVVGRGHKVLSINDFSRRSSTLAPILRSVRFR